MITIINIIVIRKLYIFAIKSDAFNDELKKAHCKEMFHYIASTHLIRR